MQSVSVFLDEAKALAGRVVQSAYSVEPTVVEQIQSLVSFSPQSGLAHAALPCHSLAKVLRQAPKQIAARLCEEAAKFPHPRILEVRELNGYLNFIFNLEMALQDDFARVQRNDFLQGPLLAPTAREKVIVEFSQPNTHKAIHVGHLRNAVYGDVVSRLLEAVGHTVIRATYPGDMGAHIAKALWYIGKFKKHEVPLQPDTKWLGRMYAESDQYIKSLAGTPQEQAFRQEVTTIIQEIENQQGVFYDLYTKTREWSLQEMRDIYQWLGIHFDIWFYESECDRPSRDLVQQKYKEGFFVLSEGAIGLDLNPYDLGFAIYLKTDGTGLYLTKDLELIRRKFADSSVTQSIYVVDSRQRLHFRQLFKTAELMGYPQAKKSLHLGYESVTDETGAAFSSRSLNGISLEDLRRSVRDQVVDQYLKPLQEEWPETKVLELADQVVLGAIKYGMLKVDPNRIIQFILKEWIQLDGETGPYLQYAHARCASIRKKVGEPASSFKPKLVEASEREVVLHLEKYNVALLQAAAEYKPSILCAYLYDLAKLFNRFYKECPIKTAEDADVRNSRLAIVCTVQSALRQGLAILGIPAPERL